MFSSFSEDFHGTNGLDQDRFVFGIRGNVSQPKSPFEYALDGFGRRWGIWVWFGSRRGIAAWRSRPKRGSTWVEVRTSTDLKRPGIIRTIRRISSRNWSHNFRRRSVGRRRPLFDFQLVFLWFFDDVNRSGVNLPLNFFSQVLENGPHGEPSGPEVGEIATGRAFVNFAMFVIPHGRDADLTEIWKVFNLTKFIRQKSGASYPRGPGGPPPDFENPKKLSHKNAIKPKFSEKWGKIGHLAPLTFGAREAPAWVRVKACV